MTTTTKFFGMSTNKTRGILNMAPIQKGQRIRVGSSATLGYCNALGVVAELDVQGDEVTVALDDGREATLHPAEICFDNPIAELVAEVSPNGDYFLHHSAEDILAWSLSRFGGLVDFHMHHRAAFHATPEEGCNFDGEEGETCLSCGLTRPTPHGSLRIQGFTLGDMGGGCRAYIRTLDAERYEQVYREDMGLPCVGDKVLFGTFDLDTDVPKDLVVFPCLSMCAKWLEKRGLVG